MRFKVTSDHGENRFFFTRTKYRKVAAITSEGLCLYKTLIPARLRRDLNRLQFVLKRLDTSLETTEQHLEPRWPAPKIFDIQSIQKTSLYK